MLTECNASIHLTANRMRLSHTRLALFRHFWHCWPDMKRREFLASSIAMAGIGSLLTDNAASAQESGGTAAAREFYELRLYHLRRGPQTEQFSHFYREAAIPAMNRAGIEKVGVFDVSIGPDSPTMYVLLIHKTLDAMATLNDRLADDAEYQKTGADFINAPATNPAYARVESTLMRAFEGMPNLSAPAFANGKSSIYELRTYESSSKKANRKKIEMFNHGEIPIFSHNGFHPVFFGETLIGTRLANLTYMLASEDFEANRKSWAGFGADPDWAKLRAMPGYSDADIVSNITNIFLRPAAYSQI
jgi:hypothetical protein